jgi:TRAP-type transport system periplasmic protein
MQFEKIKSLSTPRTRRQFLSLLGGTAAAVSVIPFLDACASASNSSSKSTNSNASVSLKAVITGAFAAPVSARLLSEFKKVIEANSKGQVQVQLVTSTDLGTLQGVMDQTKDGIVQMISNGPQYAAEYFPDIQVVGMPFLFQSRADFYKAMDGPIGKDINEKVRQRTGLRVGAWSDFGTLSIGNRKRRVRTLADLKGLKIRVQPAPLYLDTMKAWGANPIALAFGELYTALQTGVVDGLENPVNAIYQYKLYEVSQYVAAGLPFILPQGIFINDSWFSGLATNVQTMIMSALQAAQATDRAGQVGDEQMASQQLTQAGATIDVLDPVELSKFKAALQQVYKNAKTSYGTDGGRWLQELGALSAVSSPSPSPS